MTLEYDFIIVGGGTSGLVVAARLTEDPNISVLVLEAGEDHSSDPRITTPALWPSLLGTEVDWAYLSEPQDALAGKKIPLSQGRLLGGSSAINGEAFVANSKFSLDKWASLCGDSGWGWDGLAPYFQKSCTLTMPSQAASDYLGLDYVDQHHAKLFNGPVQASFPEVLNDPLPRAWVQTLKGLGSSITSDPFTGKATGGYVNAMSVHPITKQRSHSANAYYDPVRSRSNLCLITSAFVNKVVFDGKDTDVVAKGVSYTCNGSSVTVIARKEVVLAAGVFNTPKLLELSGIGSASLLARYHISVVINNANVGENLQDHPNAGFSFEVHDDVETVDGLARQDPSSIGAAMDMYATNQNGPFASGGNIAGGFLPVMDFMSPGVKSELSVEGQGIVKGLLKSQTDDGKPFTEEHTAFVGSLLNTPTEGSGGFFSYPAQGNFIPKIGSNDIIGSSEPGKFFTICCMLLHPLSRGSSHITSSSPDAKPVIDPRYLSNPLDLEILARHVRYISKIASAEPLSQLLKPNGRKNYGTPTDMSSLAEVKEYVKKAVLSCWHPTSTCAMLPLDKGGVVDSTLLVYGTKNLRIVDASVFPLSSRGNCQSTVYAVAEKAADLIKGEYTS